MPSVLGGHADRSLTGRPALLRGDDSDPLLIESTRRPNTGRRAPAAAYRPLARCRPAGHARVYLIAGTQHGGRAGMTADPGPAVNPRNPHNPMPAVRALLVALDAWVTRGEAPPPSRVPTLADGTLVAADQTGFPAIPGAAIARIVNRISPPGDWVEPARSGATDPVTRGADAYRPLVCKVDADGNEVAGIRLPDIAVPLATSPAGMLPKRPTRPASWRIATAAARRFRADAVLQACRSASPPIPQLFAIAVAYGQVSRAGAGARGWCWRRVRTLTSSACSCGSAIAGSLWAAGPLATPY
jgi:hypothetical protein